MLRSLPHLSLSSRHLLALLLCGAASLGCSAMTDEGGVYALSDSGSYYAPELAGAAGADGSGGTASQPYAPPSTNPFVITAHDPLSTFAADVDTASSDIYRRDIESGVLPQPGSVRLEDFINFFSYDYPAPAANAALPFAIQLDAAPSLASRGTQLLRVGIAASLPDEFVKKPTNLVFLIDTSGSMSENLALVTHTLTAALDILDADDTVSIVTYAGSTRVALAPTPVSSRSEIEQALSTLESGGSTNGAGGLELAYEQAAAGFVEGGINHVVLCTDGDFNVGPSSTEELVQIIEEKRKSGITLTALGYGDDNLNDAMMESVSNKGNGVYGYIGDEEQADEYVAERLLSTLHFVAKDVKLQVEFNPEHVYAYRLLGYENRAIADDDFRNDIVDAGEIGAGHRVTALYEIIPSGHELPMSEDAPAPADGAIYDGATEVAATDLVLVKVRYKNVDASESDPAFEVSQSLTPDAVATETASSSSDLQWASAVAAFAEILKQSPYADVESLDAIEAIVEKQATRDDDRAEFAELFAQARQLLNE